MGDGLSVQERVGLRVKELRNTAGYSQEQLALEAGVDRTYINSVENGRRNISINTLSKILTGLDLSLRDFFNCDSFRGER